MATYKELHGINVQYRDADAPEKIGDVWYNSSTGKLRMYASTQAWASAANLHPARSLGGGAGPGPAHIAFSGSTAHNRAGITSNVESYDGSAWTETTNMGTARYNKVGSAGTSTAALGFGGYEDIADAPRNSDKNESWDGSSWTELGDLTIGRSEATGCGTQTAALLAGHYGSGHTEEWNGTSWAEQNNLNTPRYGLSGAGIQTAAIAHGGYYPSTHAVAEKYDGTSWTEVGDLNTGRYKHGGSGTQDDNIAFGGSSDGSAEGVAITESFDGSSWTEIADQSLARMSTQSGHNASSDQAMVAGGHRGGDTSPTDTVATSEEYTGVASVETVAFD